MKSSLPFTSVVSYHTDPFTCGVARFGEQLSKRLGVPFYGINEDWGTFPLLSLKWSELTDPDDVRVLRARCLLRRYGLFWHDAGDQSVLDNLTGRATQVFYADPSLGSPGLWCPSLLTPSKPRTVRLFSFGMAHKLQTQHYAKVRQLLDAAGLRYHLRVSVGLHEGTSLSDATKHFDTLKDVMGTENVTILGILSDDAVAEELAAADYVLAFFKDSVRLNNTTVHAAIESGARVITNGDAYLAHAVLNIDGMLRWPSVNHIYSWDALIEAMKGVCEQSKSPVV